MDLIFCAAKNKRYAQIAVAQGFLYGAQLPNTVYLPPYFVDQDWRDARAAALDDYVAAVARHRPYMATVTDWVTREQLPTVLAWAEAVAPFVHEVIIIPKVVGEVARLPRTIGGTPVRLGFSVETTYGATPVPWQEFVGWPVHLLGGDPARQMALATVLDDVRSADGNKWMRQARRNQAWVAHPVRARNKRWPQLQEMGLGHLAQDTNYTAFKLSSANIRQAWQTGSVTCQLPLF